MGVIREQLEEIWAQQRELTKQAEALQATCDHPVSQKGLNVMYTINWVFLCVECNSIMPGEPEIENNGSDWILSNAN